MRCCRLTIIRQSPYRMGHTAAALLLAEGEAGHRKVRFPPTQVVRSSTA
ncbi:hypothetical protein GA0074692_1078 [Micromonospora pallida]|uniref:LacI family transcriptional regulator n=1 Tax=Micromonospora pallida TaxID=145854 RepID=A0A1C6RV23_9ACTN|nr:hypothetical protein GA0074692_1078 [Micromonospora pallida]